MAQAFLISRNGYLLARIASSSDAMWVWSPDQSTAFALYIGSEAASSHYVWCGCDHPVGRFEDHVSLYTAVLIDDVRRFRSELCPVRKMVYRGAALCVCNNFVGPAPTSAPCLH